jgi:hypothetical protein
MKEIIEELIRQNIPLTLDVGIVKKVSGDSCQIESLTTEKDFFKCRLNAVEKNVNEYLKCTPKINSTVVFGIFKDTEKAIIISTSEVDKIEYKVGSSFLEIDKDGFKLFREEINLKNVIKEGLENQNKVNEVLQKVVVAIGISPDVPKLIEIKESTDSVIENLLKVLK